MLNEISKMLRPIKVTLNLLIGRGILKNVNNEEQIQKIQVSGLKNENITDMERPQTYGFESYPEIHDETEAIFVCPNGNRDQGLCVVLHDRSYRPTDLAEGDVRVYDKFSNTIKLNEDGIVIEDANSNILTLNEDGIVITCTKGNTVTMGDSGIVIEDKNSNKVEMASGEINITGTKINLLGATEAIIKGTTAQPEMIKDQVLMQTLQTAISSWVPVPMDGGAALKAALAGFLALSQADYSSILSNTIKGE